MDIIPERPKLNATGTPSKSKIPSRIPEKIPIKMGSKFISFFDLHDLKNGKSEIHRKYP
jgi:hypothetical protein